MKSVKLEMYLGQVKEVKDRLTYEITADIPGVAEEIRAFPYSRGEMDEPVAGNLIYLLSVDPLYHSLYLYTKVKENDFIGIRSNGKMIDITEGALSFGVYDSSTTSQDNERPDLGISSVKMDSSGNLEIMATGDKTVKVSGQCKVEIGGNATVEVSGNADMKVSGNVKLDSPSVTVTGGQLKVKGMSNTDMQGPFNAIPTCPFTGAPHCGSLVSGT